MPNQTKSTKRIKREKKQKINVICSFSKLDLNKLRDKNSEFSEGKKLRQKPDLKIAYERLNKIS